MRDITTLSIFVLTSNYKIEQKNKAMDSGADVYDYFNEYIELERTVGYKFQYRNKIP